VTAVLFLRQFFSSDGRPADAPQTVLVLVLNRTNVSTDYIDKVIENRRSYAKFHKYGLFIREVTDYPIGKIPSTWARIPAIRHAMSVNKYSEFFWYLDQDAIIMNPALSIEDHITNPVRLAQVLRREVPIVPPDSVIKTYRHVPAERVQLILAQDSEGLSTGSMLIRSGEWSKYFLDAWYDPMFRFYNFAKAEQHALEHIVQWHPTILTKLGLIPQNLFNSYAPLATRGKTYQGGDFVINFTGCTQSGRNCEKEFDQYWDKRKTLPL
jgi:mannan polymerase II complex MNN11 subunit